MACLKAGLLRPDGMRELHITHGRDIGVLAPHQMRLLFEGIALSPTLESLRLIVNVLPDDSTSNSFISALRRAKSLKKLHLGNTFLATQSSVQAFLEAAIVDARVEELSFHNHLSDSLELSSRDLKRLVCQKECQLETLFWYGTSIVCPEEDDDNFPPRCQANNTLKSLSLDDCRFSDSRMDTCARMVSLFQGLVSFRSYFMLHHEECFDFDKFADLLEQDNCTIQELEFARLQYADDDVKKFCARIPNMKSLVDLNVSGNSFLRSEMLMRGLTNGICHSQSLEFVNLERQVDCEDIAIEERPSKVELDRWNKRWHDAILVPLCLNRAGLHKMRRHTTQNAAFPSNLLPLVLKRAKTISYDGHKDRQGCYRAEAVFGLLRENMDTILNLRY